MKNSLSLFRTLLIVVFVASALTVSLTELRGQSSGWDHYQNAVRLQDAGKTAEAIEQLEKALAIEPQNAFYYNALGLSYIEAGDVDSAIEALEKAIELNEFLPEAYSGLGVCYNALGDFHKSISYFKKAADMVPETSPDLAVFYNNIGQNEYLLKKYDEAERTLLKAISMNDQLLTAYINLGNVYTEKGDYSNAVVYHQRAVDLAPDYPLSRNNLAFAYFKLGDLDSAVDEMKLAVQAAPSNRQFLENLDFLVEQQKKRGMEVYEEGALAGLPKEVHLKSKTRTLSEQAAKQEQAEEPAMAASTAEEPEEFVAIADEPASPEEETTEPEEAVVAEKPAEEPSEEETMAEAPEAPEQAETPEEQTEEEEQEMVVAEVSAPAATSDKAEYQPRERNRAAEASTQKTEEKAQPEEEKEETPKWKIRQQEQQEKEEAAAKEKQAEPEEKKAEKKQEEKAPEETVLAKTSPSYETVVRKRASILEQEQEREAIREQVESSPELAEDYYEGAKYNLKTGDLQAAMNDIQKAININPAISDYVMVEAMIKERSGLVHEAAMMYDRIASEEPGNSVAHNNIGHVNQILQKDDTAKAEYQKAYDADQTNGCAAGNYGSVLAFEGNCEEAITLLSKAAERGCATGAVLNNLAFCYFKNGDMTSAQQISYSALEKDPRNRTLLSNFSLIAEKSDFNYMPIKIAMDTSVDPFYKLKESKKHTPLETLTQVEPIDFYTAFHNIYKPVKIVVVPFSSPRGTERWKPTPGQAKTQELAAAMKNTSYLNVEIADPGLSSVSYLDKSSDAFLQETLKKTGADMILVADVGKNIIEDRTKSMFFGIKKKNYVDSTLPVSTKLVAKVGGKKLQDGVIEGKASAKNANKNSILYSEMRGITDGAFEDYCNQVNKMILDHFNLIKYPVRKNVVKFLKSKPVVPPGYKR